VHGAVTLTHTLLSLHGRCTKKTLMCVCVFVCLVVSCSCLWNTKPGQVLYHTDTSSSSSSSSSPPLPPPHLPPMTHRLFEPGLFFKSKHCNDLIDIKICGKNTHTHTP